MKRFLAALFIIIFANTNVYAASLCDVAEQSSLRQKVANVNVNYEIVEKEVEYEEGPAINKYVEIQIHNIYEDFYAILKTDGYQKRIDYSDTDNGTYKLLWTEVNDIATFTLEVYTSKKTSCSDEKIKTLYFTTPMHNRFSTLQVCANNPEFSLCKEFITSEITELSFYTQIKKYIETNQQEVETPKEKSIITKIITFIDNNKWYFVGGAVIAVGVAGALLLPKKKKQKELGL